MIRLKKKSAQELIHSGFDSCSTKDMTPQALPAALFLCTLFHTTPLPHKRILTLERGRSEYSRMRETVSPNLGQSIKQISDCADAWRQAQGRQER